MNLAAATKFKKKSRPISRKFWSWIIFLPQFIRKHIVRSKFEVSYDLPDDIILKQAETEDEIYGAFKLVHDSYVELGYIDTHPDRVRFTRFLALPTTVILVAKFKDEVIGTISIIPDTALKLPADTTWNLDKYRSDGQVIGEIASLAISKQFKFRRGLLLLPMCKLMYEYATHVLKLDGIVVAATHEVEPFYTDILLFEKVVVTTGQAHDLVKGNKSTCCYLALGDEGPRRYKAAYAHKSANRNLYAFFCNRDNLKNIQLPENKKTSQAYLNIKNKSLDKILTKSDSLTQGFDPFTQRVIQNLKPRLEPVEIGRSNGRLNMTAHVWAFHHSRQVPVEARIIDASEDGVQLRLLNQNQLTPSFKKSDVFICVMHLDNMVISFKAEVKWSKSNHRFGCQIVADGSSDWIEHMNDIRQEINPKTNIKDIKHRRAS